MMKKKNSVVVWWWIEEKAVSKEGCARATAYVGCYTGYSAGGAVVCCGVILVLLLGSAA